MTSKLGALALLALTCAACGDYSNEDVVFTNAVPRAEDLKSKLPTTTGTSALRGTQEGLLIDPSQGDLSAFTRQASSFFNGSIDVLLGLLENTLLIPPTHREPGERTWGPVTDKDAPAFQVRLVMDRQDDTHFTYQLEEKRHVAAETAWTSLLDGSLEASRGFRQGRGELFLRADAARSIGRIPNGAEGLSLLSASYDTSGFPRVVSLHATTLGAAGAELQYDYLEAADESGEMSFTTSWDGGPGVGLVSLVIASHWVPSGAGVASATVSAGSIVGATWVQCWNADFTLVFSDKSWAPPLQGSSTECVLPAP